MLARSSAPEWLGICVVVLTTACRKPPEADPAVVEKQALTMLRNVPVPGAARRCTPKELTTDNFSVTERTLRLLARAGIDRNDPTHAEWINPTELDSPAATTLIDDASSEKARRQAAAEFLASKFYLIYSIDHINAPLALNVKEYRRGSIGARVLRYDAKSKVVCLNPFDWLNDDNKSREAFKLVQQHGLRPDIVKMVRDDAREQMLNKIKSLAIPEPVAPPVAKP